MKRIFLLLSFPLLSIISFCQDSENYSVSFMKPGNPYYTNDFFKKVLKDRDYQIVTANLITGNDTLVAYFGQVMLIKEQQRLFYSAIGTRDSLLSLKFGFKTAEDSLGYYNAEIALSLSMYTSEKVNLSVKYNPESKTVLYKWNNKPINNASKIEITKGFLEIGMDCPNFEIQMLDGKKIKLKEIKNEIIVLNWWHTKCAPCIKEIPSLNQLVDSYKARKDVLFLAICDSPKKDLTDFLEKTKFSYTQSISNPNISEQLGQKGYPQHIIINKNGKVAFYISGGGNDTGKIIKAALEKLIN